MPAHFFACVKKRGTSQKAWEDIGVARIDELKRKLAAREGKSEYKKNCEALRQEIARHEAARTGQETGKDAA